MKKLTSRGDGLFILALAIIHLFFFLWQIQHQGYLLQDSEEYLYAAQNIIDKQTLYSGDLEQEIDPVLYTKRPLGYPLFLSLFKSIGLPIAAVLLFQNLLSIFSILLCRKLFIEYGYSKKYDPLLILLLALTPSHFIYANMIMAESLLQFLIVIMAYCLHQIKQKTDWKWLLALQMTICLALLVKPVMYVWVIPNALLLIVFLAKKMKPAILASLALLPLLVIGLVMGRNHKMTGDYSFSSIQSINLVFYNAHFFNTKLVGMDAAEAEIKQLKSDVDDLPYEQKWKTLRHWATSKISSEPYSYASFHARGVVTFFLDPGRFDLYEFFHLKGDHYPGMLHYFSESGISGVLQYLKKQNLLVVLTLLIIALVNFIKVASAIFYFVKEKNKPNTIWYLALLIAFLAFATGPLGASRFAVPVVPFILFMSVLGIKALTSFNKPLNKSGHKS